MAPATYKEYCNWVFNFYLRSFRKKGSMEFDQEYFYPFLFPRKKFFQQR